MQSRPLRPWNFEKQIVRFLEDIYPPQLDLKQQKKHLIITWNPKNERFVNVSPFPKFFGFAVSSRWFLQGVSFIDLKEFSL